MLLLNYGLFAPLPFRPLVDSPPGSFAPWLVRPLADSPTHRGRFAPVLVDVGRRLHGTRSLERHVGLVVVVSACLLVDVFVGLCCHWSLAGPRVRRRLPLLRLTQQTVLARNADTRTEAVLAFLWQRGTATA